MIIPYYMEIMGVDRPDRTNDAQLDCFFRGRGGALSQGITHVIRSDSWPPLVIKVAQC